ncbi:lariat debranching enzyme, C-terminal domain-containing protein [Multifurca ochricompacta]|uniref:Lariat debranching enzyme, C-terminal domain-containing protein n=1 Tax=Multifurca ochricompacta TaxID=376703 RepID=A0AAD4LXH2_9AGAM|nr:lariat debranching enzyme, C-terminal domain-containing protein [Multifurca ochricompacta]
MAVPEKYKRMGDFHKYYSGQATAPVLTVVIGGNHEASNHLWELYHGGWLAPNIYFLGYAGCIQVNGIRIAGASGIYKQHDYQRGHFERQPYDKSTMRSIYHIREYNIRRLSLLSSPDVFLSHDWPRGIERFGDLNGLLRRKPFLRGDIETHQLGSPPLMSLLLNLKPTWWFAAHLHARFEARVRHDLPELTSSSSGPAPVEAAGAGAKSNPDEIVIGDLDNIDDDELNDKEVPNNNSSSSTTAAGVPLTGSTPAAAPAAQNPDEITLDEEIETVGPPPPLRETKFLALDKCLPRRQFLEVIDIPAREETTGREPSVRLCYDPEWLAITRAFQPYLSIQRGQAINYPDPDGAREAVAREWDWVHAHVPLKLDATTVSSSSSPSPSSFTTSSPSPSGWRIEGCQRFVSGGGSDGARQQTEAFTALLEMENVIAQ